MAIWIVWVVIFFVFIIVGLPVFAITLIIKRKRKRKAATYIELQEKYVTGVGQIIYEGAGFGGVSFGSGGVRPMIGGTLAKSILRGFKIPYNQIIGVDLLVTEPGVVLRTQSANYVCYIENAQAIQEAILSDLEE